MVGEIIINGTYPSTALGWLDAIEAALREGQEAGQVVALIAHARRELQILAKETVECPERFRRRCDGLRAGLNVARDDEPRREQPADERATGGRADV